MDKSKIFLDFINKFTDIDRTQKAEAFSLFSQIMQADESKYSEVEAFMDDCEVFNGYEYEDLMEILQTTLNDVETKEEKIETVEINDVVKAIKQLNPEADIKFDDANKIIYSSIPAEDLELPEGFTYNEKNGINNKHNEKSGNYCSIEVEVSPKVNKKEENDLGEEYIDEIDSKKHSSFRKKFLRGKKVEQKDNDISQSTDANEVVNAVKQLNPEADIKFDDANKIIYSSIPAEDLELPEGFTYNEKNGINNKQNTKNGIYCSIEVEAPSKVSEKGKNDLGEEYIEEISSKRPSLFKRIFSKFETNDDDFDDDMTDEDELEVKAPKVEKEVKVEKEETKAEPKKESRIKAFFKKIFAKKLNDIGEEDIPLIEKEEKTRFFRKKNKKTTSEEKTVKPIKRRKISKFDAIKKFIKKNFSHNSEIKEFINFINVREDKDVIINDLYDYIISDESATNEEEFLNKLYELCGLSKNSEEKIAEDDKKKIEVAKKSEENKPVRNISKWNEKFLDIKKELFNSLDEQDRMFIDDMMAEGLNPGDPELDQMFCERKVNKAAIYKYLLNIEKIKLLNAYENLSEYERAFVDDMAEQNINKNDAEFNQMLHERCVSKDVINVYADMLEKSKSYQNKIITDYKKHIVFEVKSMDLENKKVNELKNIAKEKEIPNISKLNKKQLIQVLDELNKMKLENADKQLGLVK